MLVAHPRYDLSVNEDELLAMIDQLSTQLSTEFRRLHEELVDDIRSKLDECHAEMLAGFAEMHRRFDRLESNFPRWSDDV